VQRKGLEAPRAASVPVDPAIVDAALRSPGEPLPASTRARFESRFQHDFSDVRVHAGDAAARSADALDASAYTSGPHIVFGRGQYATRSRDGDRLLAHELTHVVQQRGAPRLGGVTEADDPAEREAERNAALIGSSAPLGFLARPRSLSRQKAGAKKKPTTKTTLLGPGTCGADERRLLASTIRLAGQWLDKTTTALEAFLDAPADPKNALVRAALGRHFHTTRTKVVEELLDRFETVRDDLTNREDFTAECHDTTDPQCEDASAYIHDDDSELVYCPGFFKGKTARWRAGALIHELIHALAGLDITDRAYRADRLLPSLSTAEAMDNAESHELFVREIVSEKPVKGTAPTDKIEDCGPKTKPLIDEALARAERWNHDALDVTLSGDADLAKDNRPRVLTHLGDGSEATRTAAARVYLRTSKRFRQPMRVQCDSDPAPACADRPAYRLQGDRKTGRGLGIGAAIGGGLGAILGPIAGLAAESLSVGLGVGFGLLGLGLAIGLIAGLATRDPDEIHVCPSWRRQSKPGDRTETLLAAVYETYGGLDVRQSRRHAALARAIHEHYVPKPPAI
jgi:hypothetical protein